MANKKSPRKFMLGGVMGVRQFYLNLIAAYPHQVNSFHSVSLPNSGSFHTYLDQFMSISDISDREHHVFLLCGKYQLFGL